MPVLTRILGLWMASQLSAAAYVGQSLEKLRENAQLFLPPPQVLKAVEEIKERELPGTLFLMGIQDRHLVFFCIYQGTCVREFYVDLSLDEALNVLANSGIDQAGEQRPDHRFFSGPENCADYYPETGNLSVFSAVHGLKVQVYNEKLRKTPQTKTP